MGEIKMDRTNQLSHGAVAPVVHPTTESYQALTWAYGHFNTTMFGGSLPPCIITMPRTRRRVRGFFSGKSWANATGTSTTHEIALNPMHFQSRSMEGVLSTLVHEMIHLMQEEFGKPGRGRYHNKQWANWMRQVGLIPSDTGKPGGKEIGESVSHYVEEGGPFQQSCQKLLATGFTIPWHLVTPESDEGKEGDDDDEQGVAKTKRKSKTKYSCRGCHLNSWAKPDARMMCMECELQMLSTY